MGTNSSYQSGFVEARGGNVDFVANADIIITADEEKFLLFACTRLYIHFHKTQLR